MCWHAHLIFQQHDAIKANFRNKTASHLSKQLFHIGEGHVQRKSFQCARPQQRFHLVLRQSLQLRQRTGLVHRHVVVATVLKCLRVAWQKKIWKFLGSNNSREKKSSNLTKIHSIQVICALTVSYPIVSSFRAWAAGRASPNKHPGGRWSWT